MFIRKFSQFQDAQSIKNFFVDLNYNDGFAIYLNEKRVITSNMVENITEECIATGKHRLDKYKGSKMSVSTLLNGENIIAINLLNQQITSNDLSMITELTIKCNRD